MAKHSIILSIFLLTNLYSAEVYQKLVFQNGSPADSIHVTYTQLNSGNTLNTITDINGEYYLADVHVALDDNTNMNIKYDIGRTSIVNNGGSAQNVFASVAGNKNFNGKYAKIINLNGTLVSKTEISQTPGEWIAKTYWNGYTKNGIKSSNGIYFAQFPNGLTAKLVHTKNGTFTNELGSVPTPVLNEFSIKPATKPLSKTTTDYPDNVYERTISAPGIITEIDTLTLDSQDANYLPDKELKVIETKSITGTIRDSETLDPMQSVIVELLDDATIYGTDIRKGCILNDPSLRNVLERDTTDINGFYEFKNINPDLYVLSIFATNSEMIPDTTVYFSRPAQIQEVTARTSRIDSSHSERNYTMRRRNSLVPNSGGKRIWISQHWHFQGKHPEYDSQREAFLARNMRKDWMGVNMHEAAGRKIPIYLGGFSASDSAQFWADVTEGGVEFDKDIFVLGRMTKFPNDLTHEQLEKYDALTNNYENEVGLNVIVGFQNQFFQYSTTRYKDYGEQNQIIGGEITLSSSGGGFKSSAVKKETYIRFIGGWADVVGRPSMANTVAIDHPTDHDKAEEAYKARFSKAKINGQEVGYDSDFRNILY